VTICETRRLLLASLVVACSIGGSRAGAEQAIPASKQTGHRRAAPVRVVSIRFVSGGGFGCSSYCSNEIKVRPGRATLLERPIRELQQQNPQKYRDLKVDADLSNKHWQELQQLVDHDILFALPNRIPCPGCTGDEGSEFIEVTFSDHSKKSVSCTEAPKGLEALFEKLFALETKLQRELPPSWRNE
jgi:hypothetical protein